MFREPQRDTVPTARNSPPPPQQVAVDGICYRNLAIPLKLSKVSSGRPPMEAFSTQTPNAFQPSTLLYSKDSDTPYAWADATRSSSKAYNLVFCLKKSSCEVLLGFKKRGLLQGFWNGFGGKVEPGESAAEAATRELWEESGLHAQPEALVHAGWMVCVTDGKEIMTAIDIFLVEEEDWQGDPRETVSVFLHVSSFRSRYGRMR